MPEPPRQRGAGLPRQVPDLPQPQTPQHRQRVRLQPERRDGQGREHTPHLPRWRNPERIALPRLCRALRRGPTPLPVPAPRCPRPGGPRLLHDVVSGAPAIPLPGPGEPGQRPCRPHRIGDSGPHRQTQIGAILRHRLHQRRFPPEKMRASRQVDHQRLGRFLGHPWAELAGPAPEGRQKGRVQPRIGQPRLQFGAHRTGVSQGLPPDQPRSLGLGRKRHQNLRVALFPRHRERPRRQPAVETQAAFGSEPRKPEREYPALGHGRGSTYVRVLFTTFRTNSQPSRVAHWTRRPLSLALHLKHLRSTCTENSLPLP